MTMKINDNGIYLEMTADEEAAYLASAEVVQAEEQAEAEAKAEKQVARQALLTKLGITEEEAQLLLGGN